MKEIVDLKVRLDALEFRQTFDTGTTKVKIAKREGATDQILVFGKMTNLLLKPDKSMKHERH